MHFVYVSGGLEVWMRVGRPCPPVRNDIVTPRHLFFSISPFSMQRTRVYAGYAVPGTEVWFIWVLKPLGEPRWPSTDHLALDLFQLVTTASLTTHSVAHYICSLTPLTLIICFAPRASSIHRLTHSLIGFTAVHNRNDYLNCETWNSHETSKNSPIALIVFFFQLSWIFCLRYRIGLNILSPHDVKWQIKVWENHVFSSIRATFN